MKVIKADLIRRRKRRIKRRLKDSSRHDRGNPMIAGANTRYELAEKTGGTAYGGIAAIHSLVKKLKLPERIDQIVCKELEVTEQGRLFDDYIFSFT